MITLKWDLSYPSSAVKLINWHSSIPSGRRSITYFNPFNSTRSSAEERVELNGLKYVIERLPEGIEECQFINLTADEGYDKSHFRVIIPPKRRRNCYRIDQDQMNIEITRGRSEIYDILTR